MTKMTYAEAVKQVENAMVYGTGRNVEALSVLRRAGKVMEAVEGAGTEAIEAEIDYQEIDDAPEEVINILRAALACRESK